jgi:hypothetical protein
VEEGVELNLLGLTFGVDPNDVALELPLVGTFGFGAPVTAQRCTDIRNRHGAI